MPQICRRCSRINPPEALYCYHDGAALDTARSAPLAAGLQPFAYPFVFPTGRSCRNFDELILACNDNWDSSKEVLRLGFLGGFFEGINRPDLAKTAKLVAKQRDADRGLDQLLHQMPCSARVPALLVVQPLLINLGQLTSSTAPPLLLQLKNEGRGMLYGSVTSEVDWLTLGDGAGSPRKVFQFHDAFELPMQILVKNLRASSRPIDGTLFVETNGGHALVVVRVEVPNRPFPSGVLAGALTPRDLAKKAKAAPREAAVLFDNGSVRQWYESNGWTYPVRGPAAKGLASLQQFFETLGLTRPPRVLISASSIQFVGKPGERLRYLLHVDAVVKKYVFVQARSTVDWLRVTSTKATGRHGQVSLQVPRIPPLPGQRLHGFVHVTANAGQRFTVEVHLTVLGERGDLAESEVIPATGLEQILSPLNVVTAVEETPTAIPLAPTSLSDLLDALPVEPEQ